MQVRYSLPLLFAIVGFTAAPANASEGAAQTMDELETAETACKNRDYAACETAGESFAYASAKQRNTMKAVRYLEKACGKGKIGTACSTIGYLYIDGQGFDHDDVMAAKWYAKGCRLYDANGCYMAGVLTRSRNSAKAADYFRKALALKPDDSAAQKALISLSR